MLNGVVDPELRFNRLEIEKELANFILMETDGLIKESFLAKHIRADNGIAAFASLGLLAIWRR